MDYTREDTTFFKGVGILAIVLHNYFHWKPGFNLENEIGFNMLNTTTFVSHLSSLEVSSIFYAFCGFLGHYGVQLFIVFSAYGLTKQYVSQQPRWWVFTIGKLKKLYLLLTIAILFCLAFYPLVGKTEMLESAVLKTILLYSSASSLTLSTVYSMFSGPFWFFALMVQVYLLYPLLLSTVRRYGIVLSGVTSYAIIYLCYFLLEPQPLYIGRLDTHFVTFGNIIGHLPEVLLGIHLALRGAQLRPWWILLAIVVFILSQLSAYFFPFGFLAISILLLATVDVLRQVVKGWAGSVFMYLGMTSMTLFVANGPLRFLPFAYNGQWWAWPSFCAILLVTSHVLYVVYGTLRARLSV